MSEQHTPGPWGAAPLAQQLIADMFTLSDMYERYITLARAAGERWPDQDETARMIGTLERNGGFGRPYTWKTSGLVDKLADRLDGARDQWIEDEVYRVAAATGMSRRADLSEDEREAWNELCGEIRDGADSLDAAINAWVREHRKDAA